MYTHKYEVVVTSNAGVKELDLASTGDKANWAPGLVPHVIRAVSVKITNDIGATGTVNFDKRITFGTDTGRVGDVIAGIALTTAHLGGKVVYRDGLNVTIKPGEQLIVAFDDAAAAGDLCEVTLWVEPVWENPSNNTAMVATA